MLWEHSGVFSSCFWCTFSLLPLDTVANHSKISIPLTVQHKSFRVTHNWYWDTQGTERSDLQLNPSIFGDISEPLNHLNKTNKATYNGTT